MLPTVGKEAMEPGLTLPAVGTATPHAASIHNALLGGKDNCAPDREAVRRVAPVSAPAGFKKAVARRPVNPTGRRSSPVLHRAPHSSRFLVGSSDAHLHRHGMVNTNLAPGRGDSRKPAREYRRRAHRPGFRGNIANGFHDFTEKVAIMTSRDVERRPRRYSRQVIAKRRLLADDALTESAAIFRPWQTRRKEGIWKPTPSCCLKRSICSTPP